MFTGIIQATGTVKDRVETANGVRVTIAAQALIERLRPADSVSINGVCQTVESILGDSFVCTAVGETLRRTTVGEWSPGARVNLEPAATPETVLGGHLVQGHVDGVGRVVDFVETKTQDRLLTVELPEDLVLYIVEKGSIAIDGMSLTIASVSNRTIAITIVPYTYEKTITGEYRRGRDVNVEVDIIAKYVRKFVTAS